MADQPRRGRNRPDSRAMWDESDRRSHYGGSARDRRDDRDRYHDDRPRSRDRRNRTRSRSPVSERRDRHRSRSRDRRTRDPEYDTGRRRGHEGSRDKVDGRHHGREKEVDKERERDGRRRDDREGHAIPKGPTRRGERRYSPSPPHSPSGKAGRATHGPYSPLPTRSKNLGRDSGHSSARGDPEDDDSSRSAATSKKNNAQDDEERRGRRPNREDDNGGDAMDEDDGVAVEDDEMSAMQAMMGFGDFGSTKGQKVAGNNAGAVYKAKKTEYRQYMNRIGGFNRPLSPGR
ncbi:hypothetical protein F4802DRAFT_572065 [Xylaria palmicola]|nr:hypothetical protein F4802DRAFT_572065 [Xylaria palmicola]